MKTNARYRFYLLVLTFLLFESSAVMVGLYSMYGPGIYTDIAFIFHAVAFIFAVYGVLLLDELMFGRTNKDNYMDKVKKEDTLYYFCERCEAIKPATHECFDQESYHYEQTN